MFVFVYSGVRAYVRTHQITRHTTDSLSYCDWWNRCFIALPFFVCAHVCVCVCAEGACTHPKSESVLDVQQTRFMASPLHRGDCVLCVRVCSRVHACTLKHNLHIRHAIFLQLVVLLLRRRESVCVILCMRALLIKTHKCNACS